MSASLLSSFCVAWGGNIARLHNGDIIQIIINILCNGIRQPPFADDLHNNHPETGDDNGGEKGEVVRP